MNKLMTTLVGATAVLSLVAFAQGSAHAQRGNGGGGFGGFAGGFGGQRGGGMMQMGLSSMPVDVLVKGLKLTDDQKPSLARIVAIGAPEGTEAHWETESAVAEGVEFTRELEIAPAKRFAD